jgi:peptidoglycan hydrolase-like protein with peptidoglycan-binding domain
MEVISITFLVGIGLIVVAVIGGGIQYKDTKVPELPVVPRIMLSAVGCALLILCDFFPGVFPSTDAKPKPGPAPTQVEAKEKLRPLGAAVQNGLISVRDVKTVLHHQGQYVGPLNEEADDLYFQAVGEFQLSQKIDADGLVGPVTYQKLREAWPEHFGPTTGSITADSRAAKPN